MHIISFKFSYVVLSDNYTELDAKCRKYASAPTSFTSTCSPDNAQKPQIWPVSVKGLS